MGPEATSLDKALLPCRQFKSLKTNEGHNLGGCPSFVSKLLNCLQRSTALSKRRSLPGARNAAVGQLKYQQCMQRCAAQYLVVCLLMRRSAVRQLQLHWFTRRPLTCLTKGMWLLLLTSTFGCPARRRCPCWIIRGNHIVEHPSSGGTILVWLITETILVWLLTIPLLYFYYRKSTAPCRAMQEMVDTLCTDFDDNVDSLMDRPSYRSLSGWLMPPIKPLINTLCTDFDDNVDSLMDRPRVGSLSGWLMPLVKPRIKVQRSRQVTSAESKQTRVTAFTHKCANSNDATSQISRFHPTTVSAVPPCTCFERLPS
jgi:hypothetical protein